MISSKHITSGVQDIKKENWGFQLIKYLEEVKFGLKNKEESQI